MKCINKPLLLIGPGISLSQLYKYDIEKYNTLVFSGDLMYFHENNIVPDYFTFLDPYTLWWINNNINQQIATSSDGITWTLRNTPNNNWTSVCWSSKLNLFVAVANSGSNRVMISSNGINWSTNTINYSSNKPIIKVVRM